MSSLADLEARVAALEASQYDYRAVLASVNALGANQREMNEALRENGAQLTRVESSLDDTNTRVRSLEDTTSEIKELLLRALDR